nr:GIY-YIG nuclease family protein [uncultured Arsenicibacter sp.]
MHTVYIIYSESLDNYHIGLARDLQIALWQHNAKAVPATADGKPWVLKFSKSFETRKEAQSLEMKLKHRNREFWEELIQSAAVGQ